MILKVLRKRLVNQDIISDSGYDLIPKAKAYYDPYAIIEKASTFSLDVRRLYVNRSQDSNDDGWKHLLLEELLEVISKRTNDLFVASSFQK